MFVFLTLVAVACVDKKTQMTAQEQIRLQEVCPLEENIRPVGHPTSLDRREDGSFLVSNGDEIIGYDASGMQTFVWNKKGRGPFEYLVSQRVRTCADRIYVWDSGSTNLIAYDRDGNGLWTYTYDSAICDFYPTETAVYFYPCGRKWESLVAVLDLESMSVTHSLGSSSMAHKMFQAMDAAVPVQMRDRELFFMPRDKMELYRTERESPGTPSLVRRFESGSFRSEDIREDLFEKNPAAGVEFVTRNSFVVALAVDEGSCRILTAEGSADPGGIRNTGRIKLNNSDLHFKMYRFDGDEQAVSWCERVFNPALISVCNGNFYVLKEDEENEKNPYRLVVLE